MEDACLWAVRPIAPEVKRWRGGDCVARRAAAGLLELERKFRKVQGYRGLRKLVRKLSPEVQARAGVA